ncbi:hypothetical protein POM88_037334 [Heracleum sosnowskyi]|uniref:Uncharacterized protein n=1 Tax=Heracleum sosnowskyi TaxID=360622 RepID=A0AAD8HPX7_9APIA|nr:hypothetical protein POM88_037334 [Heracleum sosnowskyi]
MEAQGKKRGKTLFSFFKPSASATATPTPTPINEVIAENPSNVDVEIVENQCVEPISKVQRVEIDLNTLERDPGIRIPIWQHKSLDIGATEITCLKPLISNCTSVLVGPVLLILLLVQRCYYFATNR